MSDKDLRVGELYTLAEIGALVGNGAIIDSDRIITEDLSWSRMTVGRLTEWLLAALKTGEITPDTLVFVDSDPEGNSTHPMRAAASLVPLTEGPLTAWDAGPVIDEEKTSVELPAKGVWFGVGY